MPSYGDAAGVMWGKAIVTLVGNIGISFVPAFVRHPIFGMFIQPLTTIVFLMEALMFLLPVAGNFPNSEYGGYTGGLICVLFVVVCAILECFLPGSNSTGEKGGDPNKPAQSDDQVDASKVKEKPTIEGPKGGKPDVHNMGNFQIFTAIVVVIMWITYLVWGIVQEASIGRWWDSNHNAEDSINSVFETFFRFLTLQFVFGMWVMKDSPPTWLYFVYMMPLAVLNPLGMIISFYVHKPTNAMYECSSCFHAIFAGVLCYIGFRMMFTFQDRLKSEGVLKNQIIQIVILSIGFLWEVFVKGIAFM